MSYQCHREIQENLHNQILLLLATIQLGRGSLSSSLVFTLLLFECNVIFVVLVFPLFWLLKRFSCVYIIVNGIGVKHSVEAHLSRLGFLSA